MHDYAKLVGRKVVPCDSYRDGWESKRKVGDDYVGEVHISTVFLVLNHGWHGVPLWFETMIFGGEHDGFCDRYTTFDQAEAGHVRVVEALKAGRSPESEEVSR